MRNFLIAAGLLLAAILPAAAQDSGPNVHIRLVAEDKGGAIVLISSSLHLKGLPEHGTYAATKAAVRSLARTWATELKDKGIRVNTLSPGATDTPIIAGQFRTKEEAEGAKQFFASITPLGRIGRPEEMAKAILFLASDDSSYSTGIDLVADGGITQV